MATPSSILRRAAGRGPGTGSQRQVEGVRLIPVDGASATARPHTIGETYLERAHNASGLEQQHLFAAEAEVHARKAIARGGSLKFSAEQAKLSVSRAKTAADTAAARYEQTAEALGPYIRRKATSSVGYMARTAGLLIGDIAGLSGAGIALGEYPTLAITQAIAAGTATITAGLAATQLRHLQQAAERQIDTLPKNLEPYRPLFTGPIASARRRTAVLGIAVLIAVLVAVGVLALRTTVEGPLSGLTFGALAAAIAAASFINSWYHADLVADAVESARHDAERADRRHRRLAKNRTISNGEHADLLGKSVITEYTHRGLAAAAHIEASKYRALLASPDVVGHGPAPSTTTAQAEQKQSRARSA
ncbi:hypothetical protein [Mycolicibacterium cosmeticum]|uniref:hypothetical protein n=1 Tax=Mycolicibacterium cosmeticum TaxID=258533 RepID=UPI003204C5EB